MGRRLGGGARGFPRPPGLCWWGCPAPELPTFTPGFLPQPNATTGGNAGRRLLQIVRVLNGGTLEGSDWHRLG